MTIGFIGLGKMGLPMASNLVKAGFSLEVFNRTASRAKGLPVKVAESPQKLAKNADVIVTMVSDDQALLEISSLIRPEMKKGAVHMSMSTVSPSTAEKLEREYDENGLFYVAAPVLGRPPAAEAKQLFILLAGKPKGKNRILAIANALSQRMIDFGTSASAANTVKLMVNYMIFVTTEMLSEVMLLAERTSIDKNVLLDAMTSTIFGAPVIKNYGGFVIQEKENTNGFATRLASKDLRLIQETAQEHDLHLPLANVIQEHFKEIINNYGGEKDVALLISYLRQTMLQKIGDH
jgi:3-hydroxyisobutyrate dehydrogenase-like beta-hydroxyacid dehydrogenase